MKTKQIIGEKAANLQMICFKKGKKAIYQSAYIKSKAVSVTKFFRAAIR